jgi:hypothetical protein
VEPESEEEDDEEEEEEDEEDEQEPEDEEEEDEAEDEEQIEDAEGSDQELDDAEDSEEDAEGEEASDEDMDDVDIDDHPPAPIIQTTNPLGRTKPNVTVTAPPEGPMQSVEDKEMEDDEEEELSELDSNENDENDEEGEEDDDSSEGDSDSSRGATPDLSKLTRRQRGLYEEADAGLMALSNEAQKKKHLTAEEHAMRRAEMARRRKNLSEKRNEEEKVRPPLFPFAAVLRLLTLLVCRWTRSTSCSKSRRPSGAPGPKSLLRSRRSIWLRRARRRARRSGRIRCLCAGCRVGRAVGWGCRRSGWRWRAVWARCSHVGGVGVGGWWRRLLDGP